MGTGSCGPVCGKFPRQHAPTKRAIDTALWEVLGYCLAKGTPLMNFEKDPGKSNEWLRVGE